MKTSISIFCVVVLFVLSLSEVHAQDTKVGLKGGAALYSSTLSINLSLPAELGGNISEEETSDIKTGFAAGIFIEKPFSDLISGQIEALYVQKGGKEEVSEDEIEVEDGGLTLSYIDIPVLLKINVPLESNIRPFVYGGGFAGYLLDASAEANGEDVDDQVELKDFLTDLNYGLIFGAGVSFGSISVDLRYDLGLANIFDSESDAFGDFENEIGDIEGLQELLDGIEVTTSGFMATIGFSF